MREKLKGVSVDLDGTLICTKPVEDIITAFLNRRGVKVNIGDVKDKIRSFKLNTKKILSLSRDPKDYYIRLNNAILSHLGFEDVGLAEELLNEWFEKENFRVFPDTYFFLRHVKENGLRVVILSNNLSWEVEKVLNITSIRKYVDSISTPDITGTFKPDQEAFHSAAKAIGLTNKDVIHIGDSIDEDYEGALRAGMKALLVIREGEPPKGIRYVRNLIEATARVRYLV